MLRSIRPVVSVLRATAVVAMLAWGTSAAAEDFKWIQQTLNELGYDAGPVDGALGPRTRAALGKFQADRGLEGSGKMDVPTNRALQFARRCDTKRYLNEEKERFLAAIFCEDRAYFDALLAEGADPQETTERGTTALMMAAALGRDAFIAPILATGADIDEADGQGRTALIIAVQNGREDTVRQLLDAGADRYAPRDARSPAARLAEEAKNEVLLDLVQLEFPDDFKACVREVMTDVLADPRAQPGWLVSTGELQVDVVAGNTSLIVRGMPRYVLSSVDNLFQRAEPERSVLAACETRCASYCLAAE